MLGLRIPTIQKPFLIAAVSQLDFLKYGV